VTALSVEDGACDRGGRRLFDGLSLRLNTGQAGLVTGANGSGKSSLLRMIAGLLDVAAGSVTVDGTIALADEHHAMDRDATLAGTLGFWSGLDGRDASTAMTAFALGHLADVPVRMLSTGQRKRAVLARTMASGADIWLLDEPGNGLDQASLTALTCVVTAHLESGGIALISSHQPLDLAFATEIAL